MSKLNDTNIIINGLDAIDTITFIRKKTKRFQALLLDDVENVIDKDSEDFIKVRKLILDYFNDYTRSIIRLIFGDIEKENVQRPDFRAE